MNACNVFEKLSAVMPYYLSFCNSSGCKFYGFLHLDCPELSLNKLNAKIIGFRTAEYKLA